MVSNTECTCTMDFCHLRHKSNQPTNQKTTRMLAKTKRFRGSGKVRKANLVGLKTTDCFCCVQWGVNSYV